MIGDSLVIDVAAVGRVRDGNRDAARTLSVRGSALIVGCGGGLEGRDRFDRDCGLGAED